MKYFFTPGALITLLTIVFYYIGRSYYSELSIISNVGNLLFYPGKLDIIFKGFLIANQYIKQLIIDPIIFIKDEYGYIILFLGFFILGVILKSIDYTIIHYRNIIKINKTTLITIIIIPAFLFAPILISIPSKLGKRFAKHKMYKNIYLSSKNKQIYISYSNMDYIVIYYYDTFSFYIVKYKYFINNNDQDFLNNRSLKLRCKFQREIKNKYNNFSIQRNCQSK